MPAPITASAMAPKTRNSVVWKRVDPGGAAHAAEEDVAHHHQRHQRAAEPVGHAARR